MHLVKYVCSNNGITVHLAKNITVKWKNIVYTRDCMGYWLKLNFAKTNIQNKYRRRGLLTSTQWIMWLLRSNSNAKTTNPAFFSICSVGP